MCEGLKEREKDTNCLQNYETENNGVWRDGWDITKIRGVQDTYSNIWKIHRINDDLGKYYFREFECLI